jgi:hypothetical protein
MLAQEFPRHWVIGVGTNLGNYKIHSPWGSPKVDVKDNPSAGINLKLNHFWGINEQFYLGSGVDLIMMHHRFKPSYQLLQTNIFDKVKVRTNHFGVEVPVYFKWNILRQPKPYDFAISLGHKFSYFYGNPSQNSISTDNQYTFEFFQSYHANDGYKFGVNYALFAEFYLIKKRLNGKDLAISLNYTHYFDHSAFARYEFKDAQENIFALGQIQGYCNYIIVNVCYKFDRIKEEIGIE